jgi:hypothetical protein
MSFSYILKGAPWEPLVISTICHNCPKLVFTIVGQVLGFYYFVFNFDS